MAIAGHIKVTPEELSTQAEQVRSAATEMKNCFDRLKNLVSETSYYWKGEAAEAHREGYNKNQTSIEEIIARYNEHVRDLENMAGIYREAETAAGNLADELPASML